MQNISEVAILGKQKRAAPSKNMWEAENSSETKAGQRKRQKKQTARLDSIWGAENKGFQDTNLPKPDIDGVGEIKDAIGGKEGEGRRTTREKGGRGGSRNRGVW